MPDLLTLPAWDVRPHDSIREGTRVVRIAFRLVEKRDPLGYVRQVYEAEITSAPAKWVCLGEVNDHCIHCGDTSTLAVTTAEVTATFRVLRPAPMEPAECGFTGRTEDA